MNAFERVIAQPRSISARRELAREWRMAGDPRSDLIERQLRKHDGLGMLSRETVPGEIADLIERHGREWAGKIAELTLGYSYELGLVSRIGVHGDVFVKRAAELVRMSPIIHLGLRPPLDLAAIASVPDLAQICTLSIAGGPWLNDEGVIAFANSPNIRGMREIDFSEGQITQKGLSALVSSPYLGDVISIDITDNPGPTSGRLGTLIERRYYLLGRKADPYLAKAFEEASQSYTGGISWPPLDDAFIWEE